MKTSINALLASTGTILLAPNQWIQDTGKSLEIWQNEQDGREFFIARYRKVNRWVGYDKTTGKTALFKRQRD